jgi:hypothetical protein
MVVECEFEKFKLNTYQIIKRALRAKFKMVAKPNEVNFDEWIFIDFDNCLNGNPHLGNIQKIKE